MNWFRRNIRTGSGLALLALALQFVLSFGHFHIDGAIAAASGQASIDLSFERVLQADERLYRDGQTDNEPCTVCAVMSAAKKILFAAPIFLLLPDAVALRLQRATAAFASLGKPWPAFQSRAPPLS